MAKVNAPLFGFSATGTIGKAVTFAGWKGVPYARQRVTPSNPRTTAQQSTRNTFKAMSDAFKASPTQIVLPWQDSVSGKPLTSRNAFIGQNTKLLRGETSLAKLLTSPGTRSAPAIGAVAAVAGSGSGEIDVSFGVPTPPNDWTLEKAYIICVEDDDPVEITDWAFDVTTDLTLTGAVTVDGLTPATAYAVSVFLEYERPDGLIAYSVSRTVVATSGA